MTLCLTGQDYDEEARVHLEFEDGENLHIALHPVRMKILASLTGSGGYAAKLASGLHLKVKLIQFHLSVLEKHGLVKARYGLAESDTLSRPVAVKLFALTGRGLDVVDAISRLAESYTHKRQKKIP